MVYIYFFFLIFALFWERKSKNKYFWRVLIPLVYSALVGFRGLDVGIDTHAYFDSYYEGGVLGLGFVEPGFDWINTHLYGLGFNANFSFFVYALITNLFFFLALESLSKTNYTIPAFCLYFLTYLELINGMRQCVACAVFLFALVFIKKRKPLIYVGLLLMASLIHAFIILMIPLYFINRLKLLPKVYLFIYIISFIGVFADISAYIPTVELLNRSYAGYVDNLEVDNASFWGFFITNLANFTALLFIINTKLYKEHKEVCLLSLFYFLFTNLAFHFPILNRVSSLFIWFTYFLYAEIWYNPNRKRIKFYMIGVWALVFFNLLFIGNSFVKDNYQYYFYWEKRPTDFTHKYT